MTSKTDRPVIAVSGIEGSGKSNFARRLTAEYRSRGVGVLLMHIDDFRRKVTWKRDDKSEADVYSDDYYDLDALERCITAYREGKHKEQRPLFDIVSEEVGGSVDVELDGVELLIVEGVFLMRLPSTAEHFRIWLSTSFPESKRRMIARPEPPWRTREEKEYRMEHRYFPAQKRYLSAFSPDRAADVHLDNEDYDNPVLVKSDLGRLPEQFHAPLFGLLPKIRHQ